MDNFDLQNIENINDIVLYEQKLQKHQPTSYLKYKNTHPIYDDSKLIFDKYYSYPFVAMYHKSSKSVHHIDFRIMANNKVQLMSWAIPTRHNPSSEWKNIRKVIQFETNPHPLSFLTYEGTKEYVPNDDIKLIDSGNVRKYEWGPSYIKFYLYGKENYGMFSLIRLDQKKEPKDTYQSKWLLIKSNR